MTTQDLTQRFAEPRVRALLPDEASQLSEFAARLFRETYADDYERADVDDYIAHAFSPELQAAELREAGGRVLVIEDREQGLLGYAQLRQTPAPEALAGRYAVEVSRFYVDRRWHGTGLARVLMSACIAEARSRGADALWLCVYQHNARAVAFYEKSGFRRAGTAQFRLGRRVDDDWVMVRLVAAT